MARAERGGEEIRPGLPGSSSRTGGSRDRNVSLSMKAFLETASQGTLGVHDCVSVHYVMWAYYLYLYIFRHCALCVCPQIDLHTMIFVNLSFSCQSM